MAMKTRISTAALQHICRHAGASPDREVCGLLFGGPSSIEHAQACDNRSSTPATAFEIDAGALIAAFRRQRAGGPRLVGYYHSHPNGSAIPSARDAAEAAPDGMIWLIVAGNDVRAWSATATGAIEGRFDPVDLVEVPASCASGRASSERP
jgi:proteasome lid subunit RPN8/RPN11